MDQHSNGAECYFADVRFDAAAREYRAAITNKRYAVVVSAPTQPKLKGRMEWLIRDYLGVRAARIVFVDVDDVMEALTWAA